MRHVACLTHDYTCNWASSRPAPFVPSFDPCTIRFQLKCFQALEFFDCWQIEIQIQIPAIDTMTTTKCKTTWPKRLHSLRDYDSSFVLCPMSSPSPVFPRMHMKLPVSRFSVSVGRLSVIGHWFTYVICHTLRLLQ